MSWQAVPVIDDSDRERVASNAGDRLRFSQPERVSSGVSGVRAVDQCLRVEIDPSVEQLVHLSYPHVAADSRGMAGAAPGADLGTVGAAAPEPTSSLVAAPSPVDVDLRG